MSVMSPAEDNPSHCRRCREVGFEAKVGCRLRVCYFPLGRQAVPLSLQTVQCRQPRMTGKQAENIPRLMGTSNRAKDHSTLVESGVYCPADSFVIRRYAGGKPTTKRRRTNQRL